MDTDGCIGKDGHMEYSTTSARLAEDVVWLVRSLGGVALIKQTVKQAYYEKDGERIDCRDCYRVTVTLPFNPFHVKHKTERWKLPQERYLTRYIDRIEDLGYEEDSCCIEVEHPSHCYLANDFIVTHNSAVLAWIGWNFLLTRPDAKCAATSISGDNLSDGLWTEMAKWQDRSPILKSAFEWTQKRIINRVHPQTWYMAARTWAKRASAEELGNTLAGLHSDYILMLIDEAGGIPDAIMASAEPTLASCVEGHIVIAGNCSHLSGPLYRAYKAPHLWYLIRINGDPDNPKRSSRIDINWARQMIEEWGGRDSPYVRVAILGEFPTASPNSLLGPEDLEESKHRFYGLESYAHAPRILGVDCAQYGADSSVIFPRQGLVAFKPEQLRGVSTIDGAGRVAVKWREWKADACFVDNTGGFGAGWVDFLTQMGLRPFPVHFSGKALDRGFANKRAEMAFLCAKWVKAGGVIPDIPELIAALSETTYNFRGDTLILEPKEDIKARLGYSPDHMDALMLTFAHPVSTVATRTRNRGLHRSSYNPFEEVQGGESI
jgi:hypothetical protein